MSVLKLAISLDQLELPLIIGLGLGYELPCVIVEKIGLDFRHGCFFVQTFNNDTYNEHMKSLNLTISEIQPNLVLIRGLYDLTGLKYPTNRFGIGYGGTLIKASMIVSDVCCPKTETYYNLLTFIEYDDDFDIILEQTKPVLLKIQFEYLFDYGFDEEQFIETYYLKVTQELHSKVLEYITSIGKSKANEKLMLFSMLSAMHDEKDLSQLCDIFQTLSNFVELDCNCI